MPQEKQAEQMGGITPGEQNSGYDFTRCKLCAAFAASPKYTLKKTTVYACAACGFHFINHLDSLPSEPSDDASKPLDPKVWDYIEGRLPASANQLRKNLTLVKRHISLSGAHCLDIGAGTTVIVPRGIPCRVR